MPKWWINSFNSGKLEADPRAFNSHGSSYFAIFLNILIISVSANIPVQMLSYHFIIPAWQHSFSIIVKSSFWLYGSSFWLSAATFSKWLWKKKSIFSVKFETWTAVFLRISLAAVDHGYYCDMMCILALLSLGRPITCIISNFSGPGKRRTESKAARIANCVQMWILGRLFYPVSSWLKHESQMTLRQASRQ